MIRDWWRKRQARRRRAERSVDDELSFHFDKSTEELTTAGLSRDEAAQAAARRFGRVDRYRRSLITLETQRYAQEARRATMHVLITSARTVMRGFMRSPGFTVGVVAILTLGLGVNAITFSLVDRLVLSGPAGIHDPATLYRVVAHRHNRSGAEVAVTDLAYADYRQLLASSLLDGAMAESASPLLLGSGDTAERVQGRLVTAQYFAELGITPAVGRFFTADESEREGAKLVVLSHPFWMRRFGGDATVLGRVLEIETSKYTVVGVAPPRFTGTGVGKVDVFLPLEAASEEQISGQWRTGFNIGWVSVIVRLGASTSPDAVEDRTHGRLSRKPTWIAQRRIHRRVSSWNRSTPCEVSRPAPKPVSRRCCGRWRCWCWRLPPRMWPTCSWRGRCGTPISSRFVWLSARAAAASSWSRRRKGR